MAIPARNEVARLPRLLAALEQQSLPSGDKLSVLLLINNSTDGSAALAKELASRSNHVDLTVHTVNFAPQIATVGMARKTAMHRALTLAPSASPVLLMTTDADAEPHHDWVAANLRAAHTGADLVTGMILADPSEEASLGGALINRSRAFGAYCQARSLLESIIDPVDHDPWPRHLFEMAGSIAVRSDVYAAVGGLDPLAYREDLAFVSKVRASGYLVRHSVEAVVSVSARTCGRAPQGMSQSLARWKVEAERGEPLLVEDPDKTIARFLLRKDLRTADLLKLRARLQAEGIKRLRSPSCEHAERAAAIEVLAKDNPDACEVPVEFAVSQFQRAMFRYVDKDTSGELASVV
ncbi:glycosyltransferase [Pararhizobium haloflavum]|uniref:glycosyltransferase n=1 Tax=Pararhizobium haloflavum TaxID=2037914 RepID=UPI0012FFFB17|nr:glycosyltransferase [Pararhizobium haloflavum]